MRRETYRLPLCSIVVLLFFSCSHLYIGAEELEAIESQEVSPCHIVFVCQGMLKDFGIPWDQRLADKLEQEGSLGLVIKYFTGPLGVIFDYGSISPGKLVAEIADEITRFHEDSGCTVPLTLRAVGFSHGSEVLARAADYAEVARFERMVFINGSVFSLSPTISAQVEDGTIGAVRNYWSVLDFITLLAPFGAGALGLHVGADATENRMTLQPHLPFFTTSFQQEIVEYLAPSTVDQTASKSDEDFTRALAELLHEHLDEDR